MSIIFTEAKIPNCSKNGIQLVTIDPKTKNQLPFPSDYRYFSCLLPRTYEHWAVRFQNFQVRSDDIWLCGFHKSGKDTIIITITTIIEHEAFESLSILSNDRNELFFFVILSEPEHTIPLCLDRSL